MNPCLGCGNNRYNQGYKGAERCWFVPEMQFVDRLRLPATAAPLNETDIAWLMKLQAPEKLPDCYWHKEFKFVTVPLV